MTSVKGVGSFAEVRKAAVELDAFGFRLAVLDLPGLIASKRAAGRAKDLLALPQIEAALRLRELQREADERETSDNPDESEPGG